MNANGDDGVCDGDGAGELNELGAGDANERGDKRTDRGDESKDRVEVVERPDGDEA